MHINSINFLRAHIWIIAGENAYISNLRQWYQLFCETIKVRQKEKVVKKSGTGSEGFKNVKDPIDVRSHPVNLLNLRICPTLNTEVLTEREGGLCHPDWKGETSSNSGKIRGWSSSPDWLRVGWSWMRWPKVSSRPLSSMVPVLLTKTTPFSEVNLTKW